MAFPTLIEHKNIWQFSEQWFDDCLNRYDQLLETPLPSHFYGAANNDNVPTFSSIDLLAWYSPWFTHTRKTYGIHLLDAGIVQFANQLVIAFEEDKSPGLARSSAVLWAAYCLYCHELCHGWVEQFIGYCDLGQYQKEFRFHKNEEAICNTAVYGLQHNLCETLDKFYCPTSGSLQIAVNELKEMINSSKPQMLKALESVMQNQPDGYKDYVPIDCSPLKHPVFLAKLSMLAKDEYACNKDWVDEVLPKIADPSVLVEIPAHYIQSPAWINPSLFVKKDISQDDRKPPKEFEILGKDEYKYYKHERDLYIDLSQFETFKDIKEEMNDLSKMDDLYIKPETIYIFNLNKIEVRLLALLLIDGLKKVVLTNKSHANLKKAIDIINRRLKEEDDDARDILDCKEELIKEGVGRFAEL